MDDDDVLNPALCLNTCYDEGRIYGDDREAIISIVDYDDYLFFVRWRWNPKVDSRGKLYLRRAMNVREGGKLIKTISLYLHIEIAKRAGLVKPSPAHCIVDHADGDSLNNRRTNLRWATHKQNSMNIHGSYKHGFLV